MVEAGAQYGRGFATVFRGAEDENDVGGLGFVRRGLARDLG